MLALPILIYLVQQISQLAQQQQQQLLNLYLVQQSFLGLELIL